MPDDTGPGPQGPRQQAAHEDPQAGKLGRRIIPIPSLPLMGRGIAFDLKDWCELDSEGVSLWLWEHPMERVRPSFRRGSRPSGDATRVMTLLEVMFVALAAVLCGAEDCTDMALFARVQAGCAAAGGEAGAWAAEPRHLQPGVPADRARAVRGGLRQVHDGLRRQLKGVVAIDGKALARGLRARPQELAAAPGQRLGGRGAAGDRPASGARAAMRCWAPSRPWPC